MICLGTIVNVGAIILGGGAGLFLKKILAKRITDTVMQGVGLAVVMIGIGSALSASFKVINNQVSSEHVLVMIISLAVGAVVGETLKIETRLESFAKFCEKKFVKPGQTSQFAQGFITATLVFCVGSMAIVGSLEDGINRNSNILMAKSALDGIAAIIFASTMGWGVILSAVSVGLYQGSLTLIAIFAAPYLTDVVIAQMSFVGSVLITGIGINMLNMAKIKVGNLLPSVFIPIIYHLIKLLK